jgi:transcriptional regulator with XRE-family HTH domain
MKKSTNNLKSLRKVHRLTLAQLSEHTGVPVSSIGAFEKGTRPLKQEHRKAIEGHFGVEIVEIAETEESAESYPLSEPKTFAVEENQDCYKVRLKIWRDADNAKLTALLKEYTDEMDWGAVKEISNELLNRKITDKLKGRTL